MWRVREFQLLHLLIFITFFLMGLFINLVQLIMFVSLPRRLFHRANYYTVAAMYGYLIFLADWWSGAKFSVYCSEQFHEKLQKKNIKERVLVLANHHTELDWVYCWQLADRAGLVGGCRALAKKVLQYVPVVGWSSYMSGDVFISRSWENDKVIVKAKVEALEDQPAPTWLFIFPEGTRFNASKHKASQEFAASRGLPKLEHHLIPRTKGFSLLSEYMEGGLMDLTFVIGPNSPPPTVTSLLMGKSVDIKVFVREFSLSEVPKGEKESGEWLMNLFKEKDEIKSAFLADDKDKLAALGEFTLRHPPRRVWSLVVFVLFHMIVLSPLVYLVIAGGPLTWCLTIVVLGASWVAMDKFVNISRIKKE